MGEIRTIPRFHLLASRRFMLSAVTAGPTILLAARKDGDVRFLGSVTLDEAPETVPLSRLPRYERL